MFVQWDLFNHDGAPAIFTQNGNVIVDSCTFMGKGMQLFADNGAKKVIFTSNILEHSPLNVSMHKSVESAVQNNL